MWLVVAALAGWAGLLLSGWEPIDAPVFRRMPWHHRATLTELVLP
jgi:hypothetical protein